MDLIVATRNKILQASSLILKLKLQTAIVTTTTHGNQTRNNATISYALLPRITVQICATISR